MPQNVASVSPHNNDSSPKKDLNNVTQNQFGEFDYPGQAVQSHFVFFLLLFLHILKKISTC